jgi:hypothetical protein
MAFGISAGAWLAGAAVAGTVGSVYTSNKASKAQENAANRANQTAQEAQDQSLAFQKEAFEYQKQMDARSYSDNAAYRAAGVNALGQLSSAKDFTGADLVSSPGYQFGLSEGNRGLTNSAAARGGLLSGAALKASTKYAQDYASTKFNDAFTQDANNKNRLATLAGIGQTSVGQTTNSGLQTGAMASSIGNGLIGTAATIGSNLTGVGNARASGYLAGGNALIGGVNQGLSAWKNYNSLAAPVTEGATNQTGNFNEYGWGYSP